jgi:hypothetical protein
MMCELSLLLLLVLGEAQAAWDLLDKRSDIYSSRPRSIMASVAAILASLYCMTYVWLLKSAGKFFLEICVGS